MLYADIKLVDGSVTRKFFEDRAKGYGDFGYVKYLLRKEFGKDSTLLSLGAIPDERVHGWASPKPPSDYEFENMRHTKFAFGRMSKKVIGFVPRDNDFDEDVDNSTVIEE
jgi:hypothetical protein